MIDEFVYFALHNRYSFDSQDFQRIARYAGSVPLKGLFMKSFAKHTIASLAIVATLALGTPALALASTTPTTTTTIVAKTTVITTLKQYRAALKLYRAELMVINLTFVGAIDSAKFNLSTALGGATNSTERISARATYRYAVSEATIARSNALTLLGKPPVKPGHKTPPTTTTTL
jgi:hypothetical protein